MKKIFLTFGDSSLQKSANRIQKQAHDMLVYDRLFITNETHLTDNFKEKFKDKLKREVRGFGYWCWKPQIILQALNSVEMGDIIHYSDIGCHLNLNGKTRLLEYFDICADSKSGILGFQNKFIGNLFFDNRMKVDIFPEQFWTKGDLLDHFGVRQEKQIINQPQIVATTMFIKKTPLTVSLTTMWVRTFSDNFNLIDDSPSDSSNLEGFVEHKHDQSIWSILTKLNNVEILSYFETQYPLVINPNIGIMRNDYDLMKYYPIWAIRDKQ